MMRTVKPRLYPSKKAKVKLIELFNTNCCHIWTGVLGEDGQRYGSFKYVDQVDLHGRRYIVEMWDGKPSILLLDTLLKTGMSVEYAYHRIGYKTNLKRRRYIRYQRGELSATQFYNLKPKK